MTMPTNLRVPEETYRGFEELANASGRVTIQTWGKRECKRVRYSWKGLRQRTCQASNRLSRSRLPARWDHRWRPRT